MCVCVCVLNIVAPLSLFLVAVLGTTDYIMSDGTVVFRTSPREKDKVIFQLVKYIYIYVFVEECVHLK